MTLKVTDNQYGLLFLPKLATLSLKFKDTFRMTVSMIVSNFVKKIFQVLTILH